MSKKGIVLVNYVEVALAEKSEVISEKFFIECLDAVLGLGLC